MNIQQLTQIMNDFVQSKGWYEKDSPKEQSFRNLAISLCLESAEVLEHFQWTEELKEKESLALELADVALYLLQIAQLADIDLEDAIITKLEQNYHRDWTEENQ